MYTRFHPMIVPTELSEMMPPAVAFTTVFRIATMPVDRRASVTW